MQCFMKVNNTFTLFSSGKDEAATTDDLLTIMPYIILQARISYLLRHIKFIEIFHSRLLLSGEKAFVFNKLQASVLIIANFDESKLQNK